MKLKHTAYFDRNNELFTFQTFNQENQQIQTKFIQLPAKSGQKNYQDTGWSTGKSPIPYTSEIKESYKLWLDVQYQPNKWPWEDKNKIGEFWPISTDNSKRFIHSKDGNKIRDAIGLHVDNEYPGSAGCIVLQCNTLIQKVNILYLREYLKAIRKYEKLDYVELVVL